MVRTVQTARKCTGGKAARKLLAARAARRYLCCTPLQKAAKNGDVLIVQTLLAKGAKVEIMDQEHKTALHHAIDGDNPQKAIVEMLLQHGAEPDKKGWGGNTALHYAAKATDDVEILQLLLDGGANLEAQNDWGKTALHYSAGDAQYIKLLQLLVRRGANPDATDDAGKTPLHHAIASGAEVAVATLLDAGACFRQDNNLRVPLDIAFTSEAWSCARLLLQNGAENSRGIADAISTDHCLDVAAQNETLLHLLKDKRGAGQDLANRAVLHVVAQYGCKALALRLLNCQGAALGARDSTGKTPLHYAATAGNLDIIFALFQCGANLAELDNHGGSVIDIFASGGDEAATRAVDFLFETKSYSILEKTILLSLSKGHWRFLKVFFERKQLVAIDAWETHAESTITGHQVIADETDDINCETPEGRERLNLALLDGKISVLRLILLTRRDSVTKGFVNIALRHAVSQNLPDMVRLLLILGADPSDADMLGQTSWTLASSQSDLKILILLLNHCDKTVVEKMLCSLEVSSARLLMMARSLCFDNLTETISKYCTIEEPIGELGGWTVLHRACERGDVAEVSRLLDEGADVNLKALSDRTPLHQAAQFGQVAVARLLLDKKADANAMSSRGKTPLDVAVRSGKWEMIQLLSRRVPEGVAVSMREILILYIRIEMGALYDLAKNINNPDPRG
ncbi:putative serine/threonine-protein phosphatase 6 regulatory ankyrin repeat subunit B [Ilyonectria robusta]